jgi:hypothetical protein
VKKVFDLKGKNVIGDEIASKIVDSMLHAKYFTFLRMVSAESKLTLEIFVSRPVPIAVVTREIRKIFLEAGIKILNIQYESI